MNSELWTRVRQLFESALDRDGRDEQLCFVREACGDDEDLLHQVLALLSADGQDTDTLNLLDQGAVARPARAASLVGTEQAGYRLLRELGAGGMGTVYEAEQLEPRRRVALKVLRFATAHGDGLRRFRSEARLLARLQHPHIAQIYDAGAYALEGIEIPYLAMEFVDGALDLATWCQRSDLDPRDRAHLLTTVCEAVHFGHLKGVIHRDLKPANLLVDRDGKVKVIDFGIARATDDAQDDAEDDRWTRTGQLLGTLQYMAPEQFVGTTTDVDVRVDVWALGVIAFELFTGRPPHDLGSLSVLEAAERVRGRSAARLGDLDRQLRGDLDTIVARCLEIEPERRYQSALAVRDDLLAWLEDRAIAARPPSTIYQLRKFTRRNRAAVGLGALAVLAVVVAGVWIGLQNRVLARERTRAITVGQLLQQILTEAGPLSGRGPDLTVVEALDTAAQRIDFARLGDDIVAGDLRHTIGRSYHELSAYPRAISHLEHAVERRRSALGSAARDTLETELFLALARHQSGLVARDELAQLRVRIDAALPPADRLRTSVRHDLAMALAAADDPDAAEALYREVLEERRRRFGPDDPDSLQTLHNIGRMLVGGARNAEAIQFLLDCLTRRRATLGDDHVDTWITADVLAEARAVSGALDQAEREHHAAHQAFVRLLGDDHDHTLAAAFHRTKALGALGRWEELLPFATEQLVLCELRFGPTDSRSRKLRAIVASAKASLGDLEGATEEFRRIFEIEKAERGASHRETINSAANYGMGLLQLGRPAEVLELLDPFADRALGLGNAARLVDAMVVRLRGLARAQSGDREAALVDLEFALEVLRRVHGPGHPNVALVQGEVAGVRGG